MHKEILSKEQIELLPLVAGFKREFYLVGGTAIALHIGHRRSIDFDLFKFSSLHHKKIVSKISSFNYQYVITRNVAEQLNINIHNVKFTFYEFPFEIISSCNFENVLKLPDLHTLAAIKAYALGRRSKWKDYIDLYYILKNYFSIQEIAEKANIVFKELFSEKLFRAQLCFFNDIDYNEELEFMDGFSVSEETVKNYLIEIATSPF
jgi:predicted DNA-binding protein YlxM (UPF0122 family)